MRDTWIPSDSRWEDFSMIITWRVNQSINQSINHSIHITRPTHSTSGRLIRADRPMGGNSDKSTRRCNQGIPCRVPSGEQGELDRTCRTRAWSCHVCSYRNPHTVPTTRYTGPNRTYKVTIKNLPSGVAYMVRIKVISVDNEVLIETAEIRAETTTLKLDCSSGECPNSSSPTPRT